MVSDRAAFQDFLCAGERNGILQSARCSHCAAGLAIIAKTLVLRTQDPARGHCDAVHLNRRGWATLFPGGLPRRLRRLSVCGCILVLGSSAAGQAPIDDPVVGGLQVLSEAVWSVPAGLQRAFAALLSSGAHETFGAVLLARRRSTTPSPAAYRCVCRPQLPAVR